ncbi:MAG: hypothetical protein LBI92_09410 [Azoarcus sp.]|nr:hypothetical protein [Azoarcus sp.]
MFLIVTGGSGGGGHNSGALFTLAAHQHVRDIQSGKFPGLPKSAGAKIVGPIKVTRVTALNDLLGKYTNIKYLAYFGHSWGFREDSEYGSLYLGDEYAPDTNLSNATHANNTPVTALVNLSRNMASGQIRLFGCQGGYAGKVDSTGTIKAVPPAEQLAKIVKPQVDVYGYESIGGSIFTLDPDVGYLKKSYHGGKRKDPVTKAEEAKVKKIRADAVRTELWLVPNASTSPRMQGWRGEWDGKQYWKTP